MAQSKRDKGVRNDCLRPEKGKKGYEAFERGLEIRGGTRVAIVDDREVLLRKYHLTVEKRASVLSSWRTLGVWVSPYVKSIMTDFLMSLASLGVNKPHGISCIRVAMKLRMDVLDRTRGGITDWQRFDKHPKRTGCGLTMPGRIEVLARSLRKTYGSGSPHPVGRKLEQIGCCVDIFIHEFFLPGEDGGKERHMTNFYRLNTHSTVPLIDRVSSPDKIRLVDKSESSLGPS